MYEYSYDEETGGIVLSDNIQLFSKEPRPVYVQEMDFLGMDHYWDYEKQNDIPIMWAEANKYWYRGKLIAKAKGGSLHKKPELEIIAVENKDEKLLPMNIEKMINQNKEILSILEQITVKIIYDYYKRQRKKMDCFHVAFSGGKDSLVLLDLVKKALPKTAYMVVFGDTGMEFPDTYDVIDKIEEECKNEGIEFYRASSQFDPLESWKMFGPPSRVLRWCCTVHKAVPQTMKIREVLGKDDYIGADFVGVRKHESTSRADYDYENYGKKQKGQYSQNPILEWNSAEIWLYIFVHNLLINNTYKKGNSRAGCLFCPMGGGKGDYFQYKSYPKQIDKFIEVIKETNERDKNDEKALETYIANGGWNARKNGRDLKINEQRYIEKSENGYLNITIKNPKTDWQEWIKTISNVPLDYSIKKTKDGYTIKIKENEFKEFPSYKKRFKQVFKKSAYCIGCGACEVNCQNGCISFVEGLKIDECIQCGKCHEIEDGCLVYHSLKIATGGKRKMRSINSFGNHAPKSDWIIDYFSKGNYFWEENLLGPNQVNMFKRFLRESKLMENNETTELFNIIKKIGVEDKTSWGLILANLAYNAQCKWYIKNLELERQYSRNIVVEMLENDEVKKTNATSIINAFKRFCELPLGKQLNFGSVSLKGRTIEYMTRKKTIIDDNRVVLYSLFKFAEACEGYYQFTLTRLLDNTVESMGISPTEIFGCDREKMEQFLNGLTAKYPEYINATFTHDLEKISLSEEKTSNDVLKLF